MEENVALDSKKQKKFVKSIRGIKKLIKKNEKIEAKAEPKKKDDKAKSEKPFSMKLKGGKIKKKRIERGLVYLSHIPHGFYEHQMTQYFKQFGVVTNARVIKSKRTGNSKGFAFVEFKEPSVAQIVAETMNNYLMGKRLIKAVYIEPKKQKRKAFRKHWNAVHNPTSVRRQKLKKAFNADKDDVQELQKARKLLATLNKTKKRLSALGINYDFFTPVDVPEALLDRVIKKEKDEDIEEEKDKKPIKSRKEEKTGDKKTKKEEKTVDKKTKKQNQKEQKEKELKLKNAGVKPAEEFISLGSDESDESYEFDSDEYEKMIGEDDDFSSGDEESEEEQDSGSTSSEDEVESGSNNEELPTQTVPTKWSQKQHKPPQKTPMTAKKPMKKQFKKK